MTPLVKKLAQDMKDLEENELWLSNIPPENSDRVPELLATIYTQLKEAGEVSFNLGPSNNLYLRIFPPRWVEFWDM